MTFFCRLTPPRVDFGTSMTGTELELMARHAEYWHAAIAAGRALGFGAVADPNGFFGVGIGEFEDAAAARAFTDADPVMVAQAGFSYEIHPMPLGFSIGVTTQP